MQVINPKSITTHEPVSVSPTNQMRELVPEGAARSSGQDITCALLLKMLRETQNAGVPQRQFPGTCSHPTNRECSCSAVLAGMKQPEHQSI